MRLFLWRERRDSELEMIQSFRENMKNTVVVFIVVIFFIVPMVLTGVGNSFLGSAAGKNAASVGSTTISNADLRREVYLRKQNLLRQEGVDPNAEFLKDENLREPVLNQLTRRAALVESLKDGGMGISDQQANKEIAGQEQFFIDDKFNAQAYRRILTGVGYTPATYKALVKADMMVAQWSSGLQNSAFTTESESDLMIGLIQQNRSFDLITIPQKDLKETISVSDEEIAAHYNANQNAYMEEERVSVDYIELSVAKIVASINVTEDEVKEEFENELQSFTSSVEYKIAHILVDTSDQVQHDKKVAEVEQKLAAGESFESLVKDYSDDKFSLPLNGDLGALDTEAYSSEFNEAVYALEEGAVSAPVSSDFGTHFVKLVSKEEAMPPKYEDRKLAIENMIKNQRAEEEYISQLELLKELVYGAENLVDPAAQMQVQVESTALFTRTSGVGIASNNQVRVEAFKDEVLKDGYNSDVLELSNTRAVVLHKKEHKPRVVKALEQVKAGILANLERTKLKETLEGEATALINDLKGGLSAEQAATEKSYTFKAYTNVRKATGEVDPSVLSKVFSMEKGEAVSYDHTQLRNGDMQVVVLKEALLGDKSDMPEVQVNMLANQLSAQTTRNETASYEEAVISVAKIKRY